MRHYPNIEDKYDKAALQKLKAADWQVDLLKLNPSYVHWGCFEDYMSKDKDGWDSRVITPTWKEHKEGWNLDEYNELVNFYFTVYRKNHECPYCEGTALNPATKRLSNDWYSFGKEDWQYPNGFGSRRWNNAAWSNHITDVEVEALMKSGRISEVSGFRGYFDKETNKWVTWENGEKLECEKPEFPSSEKVNEWNRNGMGHDGINQWICVKARAKHLGVYGNCVHCEEGEGYIYDEPEAKVALQLWYLHPRKGCSRGVYIEHVEQEDLPQIFEYLKEARDRNADRFSNIV
ncbi:MAG: hypothetical protein RLZZ546_1142 [Bacteroidota bacterium]|jgi:hypothetical protein